MGSVYEVRESVLGVRQSVVLVRQSVATCHSVEERLSDTSCDSQFYVGNEIEVKCTDGNWYKATLLYYNDETDDCDISFPEDHDDNLLVHPDLLVRGVRA